MNAKEEARCQKLIDKIDACILRVLESKPYGTRIAFDNGEWVIKDRGRII